MSALSIDAPTSRLLAIATPETRDRIRINTIYCQFDVKNKLSTLIYEDGVGLTYGCAAITMRGSSGALFRQS